MPITGDPHGSPPTSPGGGASPGGAVPSRPWDLPRSDPHPAGPNPPPADPGAVGGFVPRHWNLPGNEPPPASVQTCGIAANPTRVAPGDYVTVAVTIGAAEAPRFGRLDLFGPDGAAAGLVRNGNRFEYAWKASGEGAQAFRFVAYARSTSDANEPQILCSGSTSVAVVAPPRMTVRLEGYNKAPVRQGWHMNATAQGGRAPYEFLWTVEGGGGGFSERTNGQSAFRRTFERLGEYTLRVVVTSADGLQGSASSAVTVYGCQMSIEGPQRLTVSDTGSWAFFLSGGYGPYDFRWSMEPGTTYGPVRTNNMSHHVQHWYKDPGQATITVQGEDKPGCKASASLRVTVDPVAPLVTPAPAPTPTPSAPSPGGGGTCTSNRDCTGRDVCLTLGTGGGVCATPNF